MTPDDELPDRIDTLPKMALAINHYLGQGHEARQRGLQHYWWAGFWLLKAQDDGSWGNWGQWLEDNFHLSERQAQKYMKLAKSALKAELATEEQWRKIQGNPKRGTTQATPTGQLASEQKEPPLLVGGHNAVPLPGYHHPTVARMLRSLLRAALAIPGRSPPAVKEITVEPALTDEQVAALNGTVLTDAHYDPALLLGGPTPDRDHVDVYSPDGRLVLALRRGVLPPQVLRDFQHSPFKISPRSAHRDNQHSGTLGYYDNPPYPDGFALTSETRNHPEQWVLLQALLREMGAAYEEWLPEAYEMQRWATEGNKWVIPGTVFTTATVNNTADFKAHPDDDNWLGAYSVQTVLRYGAYTGGHLVFPRYRLAAAMESGDLLFFKADEMHGVTPFGGDPAAKRVSVVAYCRERLITYAKGYLARLRALWAEYGGDDVTWEEVWYRAALDRDAEVDRLLAAEEERWAEATAPE